MTATLRRRVAAMEPNAPADSDRSALSHLSLAQMAALILDDPAFQEGCPPSYLTTTELLALITATEEPT